MDIVCLPTELHIKVERECGATMETHLFQATSVAQCMVRALHQFLPEDPLIDDKFFSTACCKLEFSLAYDFNSRL